MRSRIFFLLVVWSSSLAWAAVPEAIVLVTGDMHSAYDRTAQFVARIDRVKTENPGVPLGILIDGDTFEFGNAVARRSEGAVEFALFAALAQRAPTVLNLGNHEPEFFGMADVVARVRAAGVQVIGANIRDRSTGEVFASPSVRVKLGAREAVVVGAITDHLAAYRLAVRPSLDVSDPVVWAKANVPALLQGATLPIMITHVGVQADRAILPLLPEGTLFAGAHDHLRFVHREGRTVYFHSGSWTEFMSIARLQKSAAGLTWEIEQVRISPDDPADEKLAALIRATLAKHLTAEETAVVGRNPQALGPTDAAAFAVEAARAAAGVDAAAIGGTTFGAGLPAGDVPRIALDACVRFDSSLFVGELTGAQLKFILAHANQGPDTPFAERMGENLIVAAPATIDPAKRYHLAVTDWGAKDAIKYFGEGAPATFVERPDVKLKAAVIRALQPAR